MKFIFENDEIFNKSEQEFIQKCFDVKNNLNQPYSFKIDNHYIFNEHDVAIVSDNLEFVVNCKFNLNHTFDFTTNYDGDVYLRYLYVEYDPKTFIVNSGKIIKPHINDVFITYINDLNRLLKLNEIFED